jgi:hypothetical protein
MDGPRFDTWTRRRFGLASGGALAAVLAPAVSSDADARKKKKKRCRKLLQSCEPQGKANACCRGLGCDPVSGETGLHCCLGRQERCSSPAECCGGVSCGLTEGLTGDRCCGPVGAFCSVDADCCSGLGCNTEASECQAISDRDRKANFGSVDPADMLRRVGELPIATWNYTSDDPSIRHIGPMAQDFAALFGVGADDRHIHPLDGQGVALAAIQGLLREIEALREENAGLAARLATLEASPGIHDRGQPEP